MKFSLDKRLSNNWSTTANYTLAKCINQGEPTTNIGGGSFPVAQIDPFTNPFPDPKTAEGPCGSDRRHMFNMTAIAISPGLGPAVVRMVTKDWQVGFILQARSGAPFTPGRCRTTPCSQAGHSGQWSSRVSIPICPRDQRDWVLDGNGFRDRMPYINPAAFTLNSPGDWGNAVRNSLRGPGFFNADLAFSRLINLAADDGSRSVLRRSTCSTPSTGHSETSRSAPLTGTTGISRTRREMPASCSSP